MRQLPSEKTVLLYLFGVSGIAALTYQICWQRLLFAAFGLDIESITIIVSAFMLGLGLGSLLGGRLADWRPAGILQLFVLFEFSLGIFGLFSPALITYVSDHFGSYDLQGIALLNFCLILFPTMLMGATLPMLVVYLNKTFTHVGVSVGNLYFFNTLGASTGSFLVGFVLFNYLTLNQTIYLAACLNFTVAALVLVKLKAGSNV